MCDLNKEQPSIKIDENRFTPAVLEDTAKCVYLDLNQFPNANKDGYCEGSPYDGEHAKDAFLEPGSNVMYRNRLG